MTTALDHPAIAARSGRAIRWRAPVLIGLLGLAISVIGAGVPSIWYDEAATISSASRTWPQLWAEVQTVDLVHALYYAGMHVWFDVVGYTPVTLRLPSAVAIGIAAALVVVLGRQLGRARLGVIAGFVFCLLPRTTWAGTEGRSYAITALLAVALTVVLLAARRAHGTTGHRRWWIAYGILALVSVVTFVYLAFIVAAHALTVLWWMRGGSLDRRVARPWLLAAGGAALVTAPFVLAVSRQSPQVFWLDHIGRSTIRDVLSEQWFMQSAPVTVAGLAGLVIGTAVLLRSRGGRDIAAVVIPGVVLPTALLLVLTAAVTPLYTPRYVTLSLPFVALLIAAAIDALRPRILVVAALAATLALSLPSIIEQRSPMAKERTDWGSVAALIAADRAEPGPDAAGRTAIIYGTVQHHPRATSRVIAYGYPDAFAGTTDVTLDVPAAETGRLWETVRPLAVSLPRLDGIDTVYLLTSRARDDTAAVTQTIDGRGWHPTSDTLIGDVRVVRYAR